MGELRRYHPLFGTASGAVAEDATGFRLAPLGPDRDHRRRVSIASPFYGRSTDVRAEWLSGSDGSVVRSLTFDGAAHDHDLFRDAASTRSGEVVVALESSRCPEWIKPLKALRYRLRGGVDWSSVDRETNRLDDADPFNYDSVLWRSLRQSQ